MWGRREAKEEEKEEWKVRQEWGIWGRPRGAEGPQEIGRQRLRLKTGSVVKRAESADWQSAESCPKITVLFGNWGRGTWHQSCSAVIFQFFWELGNIYGKCLQASQIKLQKCWNGGEIFIVNK